MDFVKEGKIEEERKKRQAEWDRVRKKDDPIEPPPEYFDNRTLYDRLKEQHDLKKKEFEEQFALKNQIKGIEPDEAQFLNEVDEIRLKKEKEIQQEEKKELEEVKKAKSLTGTAVAANVPKITLSLPSHKKENKQAGLLSSVVVSKRKLHSNAATATSTSATTKLLMTNDLSFKKLTDFNEQMSKTESDDLADDSDSNDQTEEDTVAPPAKHLKQNSSSIKSNQIVLGILPGIGEYGTDSSSQSEDSSDDEDEANHAHLNTNALIEKNRTDYSGASKLNKF